MAIRSITGFTALVDPGALGQHTEAFVEIHCAANMSPSALRDTLAGEPEVIAEAPAALTWHGRRLPGPWLVLRAMGADIAVASERVEGSEPVGDVTVRSHAQVHEVEAPGLGHPLLVGVGALLAAHGVDGVGRPHPFQERLAAEHREGAQEADRAEVVKRIAALAEAGVEQRLGMHEQPAQQPLDRSDHPRTSGARGLRTERATTTTNSNPPTIAMAPPRPISPMPATSAVLRSTCSAPATLRCTP